MKAFLRRRALRGVGVLAALLLPAILWMGADEALAQASRTQRQHQALQRKLNDSTVMILSGYPGSSYFTMARDIAAALGGSDDLRLLAVDAPGGTDSLRDLLVLRGVDLALVPANVLVHADASAMFGPGLPQRLAYITQLYGEELHVVVGSAVGSFKELHGKTIAVPPADGNAQFTVHDVLRRLQIEADVVNLAPADAIDDVRSGKIAALVLTGGKPLRVVSGLPKDGSLRLLALPFAPALRDAYAPSAFRSDDYPALIPDGQTVDGVSVNAVLVANSTPRGDESFRSRRIARFVPAFFGALPELAGPGRHPKWREVNLAAPLSGWSRFAAAEEWLEKAREEEAAALQESFKQFLIAIRGAGGPALSSREQSALFEEFVKWTRKSVGPSNQPARP
jgi:TRAP-type uncharacterized transport system substrate-binding protein